MFSEFGQLGRSETSKSGSGLGLAISKNIAEAQGGRVGVKSEVGRGSTFHVTMPRVPAVSTALETAPAQEAISAGAGIPQHQTSNSVY